MSEIKIHFKYPDGADSGMEIWPTAVTVDQVIRRVTAEIRIRDKNLATDHMACTDHRAWGLSAPGRGLLDRSTLLGDIGLAPGTRLKVENQGDRLEKRKSFDEGLRSAVEIGWLEAEEATRLKGLAREASLDDSDLDEISTEFATTRDFVAAAIHGKAHEPPGITEYRKALRAVPRAPGVSVADSVKQTLGRLREDSRLPVSSHHELARQLKIPKKIAEDLLAVPPPREGGLDRYRVELDRLKSSWPETSRDLIALKKLRKTHDISPEDHHKLALMAGMPTWAIQALYDGEIPENPNLTSLSTGGSNSPAGELFRDREGIVVGCLSTGGSNSPAGADSSPEQTSPPQSVAQAESDLGSDPPSGKEPSATQNSEPPLPKAETAAPIPVRTRYLDELKSLKKTPARETADLKTLLDLKNRSSLSIEDHKELCKQAGIPYAHVQPLFDGLPPYKIERAQAQLKYREALKLAYLDGHFSSDEREALATLRDRLKITVQEHRQACQEGQVPPKEADRLLVAPSGSSGRIGWIVFGLLILTAVGLVAAMLMDGLPFSRAPQRRTSGRRSAASLAAPHLRGHRTEISIDRSLNRITSRWTRIGDLHG